MEKITNNILRNIIKETLNEYFDKEYMSPLWKTLHQNQKNKLLQNLSYDDYENTPAFVAFLLGYDNDENEVWDYYGYNHNNPVSSNKVLNKLFKQYLKDSLNVETRKSMYDFIVSNYKTLWRFLKRWSENVYYQTNYKSPRSFKSNMLFDEPKIIKGQWICHLTNKNNADEIKGREKEYIDRLAFTYGDVISKENNGNGGYAFGYLAIDLMKENTLNINYDYGTNIMMFIGNGIEVYHKTDREKQVIFNPASIDRNNCVWIQVYRKRKYDEETSYNDSLSVSPVKLIDTFANVIGKNGNVLYSSFSVSECIKWVITNYQQYKKQFSKKYRQCELSDTSFDIYDFVKNACGINATPDIIRPNDKNSRSPEKDFYTKLYRRNNNNAKPTM